MKNLKSKYHYTLQVPADKNDIHGKQQFYFANNIFELIYRIVSHKVIHLLKGDGWKD